MSEVALTVVSPPEDKSSLVHIAGKAIDVSNALPLKVGDWRKLSAQGVDLTKMSRMGPNGEALLDLGFEQMCVIVSHVLRKADPTLPADILDDLSIDELGGIAAKAMGGNAKADRPT